MEMSDRGNELFKEGLKHYRVFENKNEKLLALKCFEQSTWNGGPPISATWAGTILSELGQYKDAFFYYLHAALNGDGWGMYYVALCYFKNGNNVDRDFPPRNPYTGWYWLRKSPVDAAGLLQANYLWNGIDCTKNEIGAREVLEKYAERGLVKCMNQLALYYDSREYRCQNSNKAGYWLNEAAKLGDSNAKYRLTRYYINDNGNWRRTVPF